MRQNTTSWQRTTPQAKLRQQRHFKERWRSRGITFSDEQVEALRLVTDTHRISLSDVMDTVLAEHFPKRYGVAWPVAPRQRVTWLRQVRIKAPTQRQAAFSLLFSHRQDELMRLVIGRLPGSHTRSRHGIFAAVIERAFAEEFFAIYGVPWPKARRRLTLH